MYVYLNAFIIICMMQVCMYVYHIRMYIDGNGDGVNPFTDLNLDSSVSVNTCTRGTPCFPHQFAHTNSRSCGTVYHPTPSHSPGDQRSSSLFGVCTIIIYALLRINYSTATCMHRILWQTYSCIVCYTHTHISQ